MARKQQLSDNIADTAKNNNLQNWKNENYLTVYGWMTNELKLTGNELLIYALIYGFSKGFRGSTRYIAAVINTSRRTVFYALKNLLDRELIVKKEAGRFCNYSVTPMQNLHTTYANSAQIPMQNLHTTCAEIAPHINIDIDRDIDVDRAATDDSAANQTTTNFSNVQETAKSLGFFLTDRQAQGFHRLDPSWLDGDFNFLTFAAGKVKENAEKPHGDYERMFAKAWRYENLLQEYPSWRNRKIAEAVTQEEQRQKEGEAEDKRQKLDEARNAGPGECRICGAAIAALEGLRGSCPSCSYDFLFNEDKGEWEFHEPLSLSEEYKKILQRRNSETEPTDDETVAVRSEDLEF